MSSVCTVFFPKAVQGKQTKKIRKGLRKVKKKKREICDVLDIGETEG